MKPIQLRVSRIAELQAILDAHVQGYVDDRNGHEAVGLDVALKAMIQSSHLHGYDGTDWVGIGHATGGKVMLDAAE